MRTSTSAQTTSVTYQTASCNSLDRRWLRGARAGGPSPYSPARSVQAESRGTALSCAGARRLPTVIQRVERVALLAGCNVPNTRLCLLNSPFLLPGLMLRPTVDTLLADDVRPGLTPADRTRVCALTRGPAARGARVTALAAGAGAVARSAAASQPGRPPALGVVIARMERMANRARVRQARDGPRLASPRLPPFLDMEEPSSPGSTDRAA